jgi:hypothetical protein
MGWIRELHQVPLGLQAQQGRQGRQEQPQAEHSETNKTETHMGLTQGPQHSLDLQPQAQRPYLGTSWLDQQRILMLDQQEYWALPEQTQCWIPPP